MSTDCALCESPGTGRLGRAEVARGMLAQVGFVRDAASERERSAITVFAGDCAAASADLRVFVRGTAGQHLPEEVLSNLGRIEAESILQLRLHPSLQGTRTAHFLVATESWFSQSGPECQANSDFF